MVALFLRVDCVALRSAISDVPRMSCELCAAVLRDGDRAPYITRLLLAESTSAVCRACRAKQAEKPREARALHVVNELVTPEVHYETWREFAELVYAVQDRYCACLLTAVNEALRREQVSRVLGSFYGFPLEFEHLRTNGPAIILELTKGQGAFWCNMVAHAPARTAPSARCSSWCS
jgi:hypothetical protein